MYTVAKNIFYLNFVGSFVRKNKQIPNFLFILFMFSSFFILQHSCYAMEQTDEVKELQSVTRTISSNSEDNLDTISNDDVTMSLLPITQESPQSWKQNWFVKNIVVEFPIVGDFFHDDPSILDSIKRAGKTTCMLVGGSVGMMLHFIPMSEKEDMATHAAKNSFNMAIGMWIATSSYNIVLSLGSACYNCINVEEGL